MTNMDYIKLHGIRLVQICHMYKESEISIRLTCNVTYSFPLIKKKKISCYLNVVGVLLQNLQTRHKVKKKSYGSTEKNTISVLKKNSGDELILPSNIGIIALTSVAKHHIKPYYKT